MLAKQSERIPIVIQPETKATILRLAELMDTSFAKLAGGFLDDARPQLDSLAAALEKASADPNTSLTTIHLAIIEAQRKTLQVQTDFLQESIERANKDNSTP